MTTAIILAGGMGTRLRSIVSDVPKPMAPVNGRPFIEYQMDHWIGQGIDHFVLSVGYRNEVIRGYFGSRYRSAVLSYAIEEEPLGTGGGLLFAAQGLDETFLLLNGDTFFDVTYSELLNFHNRHSSDWTFSLFRVDEVDRYMGLDIAPDGKLGSCTFDPNKEGCLINGGVYLVNPDILSKTMFVIGDKLSLENQLIRALRDLDAKLFGKEFSGSFIDIGTPEDYERAAQFLRSK
jgi:D-glycero-alpha-D-manno-heptose 1-phosphate guanylyltransferase